MAGLLTISPAPNAQQAIHLVSDIVPPVGWVGELQTISEVLPGQLQYVRTIAQKTNLFWQAGRGSISRFMLLEEIKERLVDALDDLKEFIYPRGFASYFVCGRVRDYGVAELSGSADTLSR